MVSLGFKRLELDYGLYVRGRGEEMELVFVYVDDLLVAAKQMDSLEKMKEALKKDLK
jgi:hypothetical protein